MSTLAASEVPQTNVCPACGGANPEDAVFCTHAPCHKALGEFRYVLEEIADEARWHEALADSVTGFIGKPHFLAIHIFWFALWILINTGVLAFAMRFDTYPFALLGIVLAMETIFITGFVLISQNRQNARSDKRAELDYEVTVRTYRKIHEMDAVIARLERKVDQLAETRHQP